MEQCPVCGEYAVSFDDGRNRCHMRKCSWTEWTQKCDECGKDVDATEKGRREHAIEHMTAKCFGESRKV